MWGGGVRDPINPTLTLTLNPEPFPEHRWEKMIMPWPVEVQLSDPINPIFKSNRTRYLALRSKERLQLVFHTACLLTLGDCTSFARALLYNTPTAVGVGAGGGGARGGERAGERPNGGGAMVHGKEVCGGWGGGVGGWRGGA